MKGRKKGGCKDALGRHEHYAHTLVEEYNWLYRAKEFVRACAYSTVWMPYVVVRKRWIYRLLGALSAPFGVINYFFSPSIDNLPGGGLAIVAIVKNEAKYIQEWISFYLLQGADKIIIYDNGSTDETAEIVKQFSKVDYYYFPGVTRQLDAYNVAIRQYRQQYRYMAFLDCDEFLYTEGGLYEVIDSMFQVKDNIGGIGVNWLHFGSSGHIKQPNGGVVENYLWRAEEEFHVNRLIKTIAIPSRIFAYVSPHYPLYRRNYKEYDENGQVLAGDRSETVSTKKLRINHYFTKSREEWIKKVERGRADITKFRDIEEFELRDRNEVFDDRLLKRVNALYGSDIGC